MQSAIVSPQGQVLIPTEIRQQLGISPGSRLDFTVEGSAIRIQIDLSIKQSRPEDGYGMLVCKKPGTRQLSDLDIAQSMRENMDDRA